MKIKKLVPEGIFRDRNTISKADWDTFKKNYLKKNPGTKSLISKKDSIEYLIHKDDPKNAVIKYNPEDGEIYHDLKRKELYSYLR